MIITSSEFIKSSPGLRDCPKDSKAEFAFIGRSNVGKSSLINMLLSRKNLAKTSSRPGKTQLINHFLINDSFYFVDLPGFGFAKISKKQRASWLKMIQQYMSGSADLKNIFFLIDSRIPPQKNDMEFINWMGGQSLPFILVFTKTDKLSNHQLQRALGAYQKELSQHWEELPGYICVSALSRAGKEEILDFIEKCLE